MMMTPSNNGASDPWIANVEAASAEFVGRFGSVYSLSDKALSGIFEIGCFLSIVNDYEKQGVTIEGLNLVENQFRYLTTPNGNPNNFSYIRLTKSGKSWELRQQVRVCSHLHDDVNFTPDIVVIEEGACISTDRDKDYAAGKRGFFRVNATSVLAAHECKKLDQGTRPLPVRPMPPSDLGHGGNEHAPQPSAVAQVVLGHLPMRHQARMLGHVTYAESRHHLSRRLALAAQTAQFHERTRFPVHPFGRGGIGRRILRQRASRETHTQTPYRPWHHQVQGGHRLIHA